MICLSEEVSDWMSRPHPQPDMALEIQARLKHVLIRVEADGTGAGSKYFRKVKAVTGLWEVRVNHATAAYRIFGGFAPGGRLALVRVVAKKRDSLPMREYKRLEAQVNRYIERMPTGGC
jgi:phage-related protein